MEYLFIPNQSDIQIIKDYKETLSKKTLPQLVDDYNESAKTGIVGARQQIRYLIAMRSLFMKHFGESPIYIVDNCVVGIKGQIVLNENKFDFIENESKNLNLKNKFLKVFKDLKKQLKF